MFNNHPATKTIDNPATTAGPRQPRSRRLPTFSMQRLAATPTLILPAISRSIRDQFSSAGGNPDALQSTGPLPVVKGADGKMDLARTMERVPAMVAIGQTSFTVQYMPLPDQAANEAKLREIVNAFCSAVGRPLA